MCLGVCLYASLYISASTMDVSAIEYKDYGVEKITPSDRFGNATIGLEHKSGAFIEVDHTSDPFRKDDRGWEEYKIGVRKEIRIF